MTERGLPIVDGAPACPFVAYEDDRDARATSPDHRHRCFAEVRPAQRALAHQEAYCLSSAFPVCPTFQDWARREAAAARPGGGRPVDDAADDKADDGDLPVVASRGVDDERPAREPHRDWSAPPPWADQRAPQGELWDEGHGGEADDDDEGDDDSGSSDDRGGRGSRFDRDDDDGDRDGFDDDADQAAAGRRGPSDPVREVFGDEDPMERSARRRAERAERLGRHRAPIAGEERRAPAIQARPRPLHDDDAPSWERPRRYEAYPTIRSRVGVPGIPRLGVLAAAVVLAGVALFFLPGLLGVGGPDTAVETPSPAASPSGSAPSASVEPTPVPEPTPVIYTVKSGDTLSKIAKQFGVTLEDLLAANADSIPDPNKIKVGDRVIIPAAPPTEFVDPSASGSLPPP